MSKLIDPTLIHDLEVLAEQRDISRGFSFSTGVMSIDNALGGGLPAGITEIFGEPSAGKTSLLFDIIATAQKSGALVALCPSEYLDIHYMKVFGIDLNSLILITGNHGEDVLEAVGDFLDEYQDQRCLVAFDSATSLRPKVEAFGYWLSMWNLYLSHLTKKLNQASAMVLVNQIRTKRSVHPNKFFAGGTDSTARKVLDQFSARLELSRQEVRDEEYTMMVNVVASIFSLPSSILTVPFIKGRGIDTMLDLLRCAVASGVVEVQGSWYRIPDGEGYQMCQGEIGTARSLEDDKPLAENLVRLMKAGR